MLQNYFFLNRFILEVNPLLENSKIEEIFSQEKSKLVLVTSKKDEVYFLEMCVIPGNSYLNLRKNLNWQNIHYTLYAIKQKLLMQMIRKILSRMA